MVCFKGMNGGTTTKLISDLAKSFGEFWKCSSHNILGGKFVPF